MSLPVVNDASALADAGNLTALKRAAAAHDPQALKAAARQFESLFISMVLKSMQKANFKDPLFGSSQGNLYQQLYDDQIAAEISKGPGLGLADMLVQQLRREGVPGAAARAADAASAAARRAAPGTAAAGRTGAPASPPIVSPWAGAVPATRTTPATASSATGSASEARRSQFAQELWPAAQQASKQLGVSPVSLIAQAALETDWGQRMPLAASGASSHNLFGMKAGADWPGASALGRTQEYSGGVGTTIDAPFRAYGSTGQCFEDYVALLRNRPRYAAALGTGNDVQAFATALQRGGYATDPTYAQKVCAVAASVSRILSQSGPSALKSGAILPTSTGSATV